MVMRLRVRFTLSIALTAALAFGTTLTARAQKTAATSTGGTYIVIDPLANVKYDNRFDLSLGADYKHLTAGPNFQRGQGANLGGLDLSGSWWLTKRWALEGSTRADVGTSGAGNNSVSINGPFVAEYFFLAGPEFRGPSNKHASLVAHVLAGGVYGDFEHDLRGTAPGTVGFYHNQVAPAAALGGHIELNRSANWVFRISPDAMYTRYDFTPSTTANANNGVAGSYNNWNFAISVGAEYRFKSKRHGVK